MRAWPGPHLLPSCAAKARDEAVLAAAAVPCCTALHCSSPEGPHRVRLAAGNNLENHVTARLVPVCPPCAAEASLAAQMCGGRGHLQQRQPQQHCSDLPRLNAWQIEVKKRQSAL